MKKRYIANASQDYKYTQIGNNTINSRMIYYKNIIWSFLTESRGILKSEDRRPKTKGGQMKIMQMSFMIIGVFFFFILVGLFVMGIMFKDIRGGANELAQEQTISSLKTIAAMPELNYDSHISMAVDKDKLKIMSKGFGNDYGGFWPIASLEVYKVYPVFKEPIKCPAVNCNYYEIYNSRQTNVKKVSSYVSICEKIRGFNNKRKCEVGKIVAGIKILE